MTQHWNEASVARAKTFSPREIQVLELASQGLTNRQIARQLGLSVHAIKFHLGSIYRKIGASNRTEAAVAYALTISGENGVDTPSDAQPRSSTRGR